MNDYEKILKKIRSHKPEIENREFLKESIMTRIGRNPVRPAYIFWWTEIRWLRRSLAIAASVIIGIFIIQQILIANRIDKLEGRMISVSTEKILEMQRENVVINSMMLRNNDNIMITDSVKVSTNDLYELMREYHELQNKYNEMMGLIREGRTEHTKQKL